MLTLRNYWGSSSLNSASENDSRETLLSVAEWNELGRFGIDVSRETICGLTQIFCSRIDTRVRSELSYEV